MESFPFSRYLFWDVEPDVLDISRHRRYIIERVITRGTWTDFKNLLELYTKDEIRTELRKSRVLDSKTRHFCSWYFEIPSDELHASTFYTWRSNVSLASTSFQGSPYPKKFCIGRRNGPGSSIRAPKINRSWPVLKNRFFTCWDGRSFNVDFRLAVQSHGHKWEHALLHDR